MEKIDINPATTHPKSFIKVVRKRLIQGLRSKANLWNNEA